MFQSQEREGKAESVSESQEMPRRKIHWRQNEHRHIDTHVSFSVAVKWDGFKVSTGMEGMKRMRNTLQNCTVGQDRAWSEFWK